MPRKSFPERLLSWNSEEESDTEFRDEIRKHRKLLGKHGKFFTDQPNALQRQKALELDAKESRKTHKKRLAQPIRDSSYKKPEKLFRGMRVREPKPDEIERGRRMMDLLRQRIRKRRHGEYAGTVEDPVILSDSESDKPF